MTSPGIGPAGAAAPAPRKRPRRLAGGYRGSEMPTSLEPPDFGEAFFQSTDPAAGTDDESEPAAQRLDGRPQRDRP